MLASSSDYFRALFSHDMLETSQAGVELSSPVTAEAVKLLLSYAYTGAMPLTFQLLPDVLAAATFLQMTTAIKVCMDFIKKNMEFDVADCLVDLCDIFGLTELRRFKRKFILDNFNSFMNSPEFLNLDGETLASYLVEDELNIATEGRLLKSVLAWYNHDPSAREAHAFNVFEKIRYVIDGWPVIEHASKQDIFQQHKQLRELMAWCNTYMEKATRRYLFNDYRSRVRSTQRTLIHIGGIISPESLEQDFVLVRCRNYFYQRSLKDWCFLNGNTCTPRRSNAPMLQINDYAVVFGGITHDEFEDETDEFIDNVRYRQDVKHIGGSGFNIWAMSKMNIPRADHVAVHVPGNIAKPHGC